MHRKYFPNCKITGPIEPPVPFSHMGTRGAVPAKCAGCNHLFEGGCTRQIDIIGDYLHLDHGPCGVDGPTDPVIYEEDYVIGKVEVPRKCAACHFLKIKTAWGFVCTKDHEKWGDLHRGLDWGTWSPDSLYLRLPPPKMTTKALSDAVFNDDLVAFIRELRRINPGLSIKEAKSDFAYLRHMVDRQAARDLQP